MPAAPTLTKSQEATASWAVSLLHALARDEAAGRRPPRLTEPRLDTWARFRGRLTTTDLVSLLFEDAGVIHRAPFELAADQGSLALQTIPESVAAGWLAELQSKDLKAEGSEYILEQAKLLRIPTRMARSDLRVVKPHQKVLELPGTGGQLAYYLATTQPDLTLQDNFVVACGSWQELTLAGVIALELGAPHTDHAAWVDVEGLRSTEHPLRQRSFDFVVGLHPDRGGFYRVEDQLAIWFPAAQIVLV